MSNENGSIHDFWMDAYPEITTISQNVAKMERAGYLSVATFMLPEECWTHHFYAPQPAVEEIYLRLTREENSGG